MAQLGQKEKQILTLVGELSEQLTSNNFREAYSTAGKLNASLKGDDIIQLPIDTIEQIKTQLRFYYRYNDELNNAGRKLYGTGKKLAELASL
ncbi:hypothetical protein GRB29_09750 [Streptococcus pneumoniae]|nr:hypothetical protein [Streptococcus pneumoniae]